MNATGKSYFGKYRGKIEDNVDVQGRGRVYVSVPDVLGDGKQALAMPCTPMAGPGVGFFVIPPKGASVWVEFERGDVDYPIWSGCFWEAGDAPSQPGPTGVSKAILKTEKFTFEADSSAVQPMLTLEMQLGGAVGSASLKADSSGLTLSCAGNTIQLSSSGVAINDTNLVVMK